MLGNENKISKIDANINVEIEFGARARFLPNKTVHYFEMHAIILTNLSFHFVE